jgi:hypothetical protein
MPLTTAAKNGILNSIVGSFASVYLSGSASTLLGQDVTGLTTIGGEKTLSWATATDGFSVSTTNSATSNPINYSVPQSTTITRLLLVNSSDIVTASMTLPATIPTYTAGDGPYYVRGITLNMVVV